MKLLHQVFLGQFHHSKWNQSKTDTCTLTRVQVHAVIGVLMDDTDPLVTVMKVEKAPQETYADIGGLDNQIQEIKVRPQGPFTCLACLLFAHMRWLNVY